MDSQLKDKELEILIKVNLLQPEEYSWPALICAFANEGAPWPAPAPFAVGLLVPLHGAFCWGAVQQCWGCQGPALTHGAARWRRGLCSEPTNVLWAKETAGGSAVQGQWKEHGSLHYFQCFLCFSVYSVVIVFILAWEKDYKASFKLHLSFCAKPKWCTELLVHTSSWEACYEPRNGEELRKAAVDHCTAAWHRSQ